MLLRFANDRRACKRWSNFKLEGRRCSSILPKKAGVAKKSQKRDREEAEAGAKVGARRQQRRQRRMAVCLPTLRMVLTHWRNEYWLTPVGCSSLWGRHGQPVRNVLVYTLPQMNINDNFKFTKMPKQKTNSGAKKRFTFTGTSRLTSSRLHSPFWLRRQRNRREILFTRRSWMVQTWSRYATGSDFVN